MITFVQVLLAIVVVTLTVLVAMAGIQVFQILHEFRFAIKRLNKILDNTQTLSESAAKPIAAVNDFFSEVKTLVDTTQDQIISQTPDRVITPSHHHVPTTATIKKSPVRVFHRSGSPLRPS